MVNYGVLRDYQKDFSDCVVRDFNAGHTRLIAVVATGGGKTVTFGHVADRYIKRNQDRVVLVLSHLGLLIPQTGTSFAKFWGIESHVLQAQTIPPEDARCVLATIQSAKDLVKLMQWGGFRKVGLVIVDEAHRMFNDSYDQLFKLLPEDIRLLAVTATPFKENQLLTSQFDKVTYTISTQELIDKGSLVKPVLRYVPYSRTDLEVNIRLTIDVYKQRHSGKKAIVYLKRQADCHDMKAILDSHGIKSTVVTGTVTGELRDQILSDFKNDVDGSADILLTVDVLTAGFDSPNIVAIFMPYPTKSVSVYLQRIGRGLRPDEGKTECAVYIGGKSPELMKKEWEKIQKKALNLGKRAVKDVFEALEFNQEFMTKDEIVANKRLADMAKKVRTMNMPNLFESIAKAEVPDYLMDALQLTINRTASSNSKLASTPAQQQYLKKLGVHRPTTKAEATVLIDAYRRAKGWTPAEFEVVPSGRFKDWQWKNVPHVYKKYLFNEKGGDTLMEHYKRWKRIIKGD